MAKLGSSSCRPLGTVLLALLLLASIQAGPVMAWEQVVADLGEKLLDHGAEKARDLAINKGLTEWGKKKGSKDGSDGMKAGYRTGKYVRKAHGWKDKQNPGGAIGTPYVVDTIATSNGLRLKLVTADITATPAAKTGFCATAVAGGTQLISLLGSRPGSEGGGSVVLGGPLRGTLQYCTAVGGPAGAVLGLGRGGDLSRSFPTFSYYVTSRGNTVVWFPQPQVPAAAGTGASITLVPSRYPNDGRYYVRMTGIRVVGLGQELVVQTPTGLNLPPPAYLYLSTTQRNTYIESNLYGRLRAAVIRQMNALSPGATPTSSPLTADKLCYAAAALSAPLRLPRIAILLASNNAARETMELGGAAWDTEPSISMFCLGILPATTEEPVLGSMIQSGRTMTIDLTAAGRLGTLTF